MDGRGNLLKTTQTLHYSDETLLLGDSYSDRMAFFHAQFLYVERKHSDGVPQLGDSGQNYTPDVPGIILFCTTETPSIDWGLPQPPVNPRFVL